MQLNHFENIWEKAEEVALQTEDGLAHYMKNIENVQNICAYILVNKSIDISDIGDILFELCAVSAKAGINVAAALKQSMDNNKRES